MRKQKIFSLALTCLFFWGSSLFSQEQTEATFSPPTALTDSEESSDSVQHPSWLAETDTDSSTGTRIIVYNPGGEPIVIHNPNGTWITDTDAPNRIYMTDSKSYVSRKRVAKGNAHAISSTQQTLTSHQRNSKSTKRLNNNGQKSYATRTYSAGEDRAYAQNAS